MRQLEDQLEDLLTYLYELVHGEKKGRLAGMMLAVLRGLSVIYTWGVLVKLSLYRWGLLRQRKLPCRVISLGNITVGGTGKTPTAERLALAIRDMGYRVVILNRGYRAGWQEDVGLVSDGRRIYMSVAEAGDEAYLLAKNLPGVAVVIGKNRSVSGDYAVKQLKADVIIMDDGYQHWQLARDFDIVLIDSINRFGNGYLLPRGTLREPLRNLNRADAFILTKVNQSTNGNREMIRQTLERYNPSALVAESTHSPQCFIEIERWYKGVRPDQIALDDIKGKKVMAFSAIGNPASFEQTIAELKAELADTVRFPDHHDYTMAEMQFIMQRAVDNGLCALVTTEKDAVKIPAEFIHSDRPLPLYVLNMTVEFIDGQPMLTELIKRALSK
ncbi:tetraacyldisaccharide 4'-kinase [Lucifera butyrica]|uniref:Tetraacyldisaccharide 4'-kinase n=1 Tax=Lucifera butyrica TaxID=1351585 RepID=A0A498RE53_9FIRM|nr:tetraacyldisaccharide 4'-kinase [Lucifera butyrica]VBB09275.1 tetraacyldisaccharide 4'-kinase [Lucifera butyrica]